MHRVTQTIKGSNIVCVNSRILPRNYVQNTSTSTATITEQIVKQATDMQKFRAHHSSLSQPTVQEMDMKNIEPSYFSIVTFLKVSSVCHR